MAHHQTPQSRRCWRQQRFVVDSVICPRSQGEPALTLMTLLIGNVSVWVFSGKGQTGCTVPGWDMGATFGLLSLIPTPWVLFLQPLAQSCTQLACWRSFCWALLVFLLNILAQRSSPVAEWMPPSCQLYPWEICYRISLFHSGLCFQVPLVPASERQVTALSDGSNKYGPLQ